LKRGRKVFDGTLAETRRAGAQVRLRTDDFPAAVAELAAAGLASAGSGAGRVQLREGVGPERIAAFLVCRGRPLYELAPEEVSLEEFYLGLMDGGIRIPTNPGPGRENGKGPAC